MQLPPFLLGAAIVFWGWHTGLVFAAVPLALITEAARWIRLRWQFSDDDYQKIWNGCLLLLLASIVFAVGYSRSFLESVNNSGDDGPDTREAASLAARWALLFFQWQPLVFAPFAVTVLLGGRHALPSRVFSWLARRRREEPNEQAGFVQQVAPIPAYFALVMFATCTTNHRSLGVFLGILGFVGWALWACRSARVPRWQWGLLLVLCGGLGFVTQAGLTQLQRFVTNIDTFLTQRLGRAQMSSSEVRSSIGTVGRLKMSNKIVMNVSSTNDYVSDFLRQASYDTFMVSTWRADRSRSNSIWHPILDEQRPGSWSLTHVPTKPGDQRIRITQFAKGGSVLLALPNGSFALEDLPVEHLSKNGLGCVRATDPPDLLDFHVIHTLGSTLDDRPTERDLTIPKEEKDAIETLKHQLRLEELAREGDKMVLGTVSDFFLRRFEYSTFLERSADPGRSPVSDFLLQRRKGHCEYFATATCLLLRAAGIPTRYAVGYAVTERAGRGQFIVRDRHAHAWCLVWSRSDNQWYDYDTTPPSWSALEAQRASAWDLVGDLGFRLWTEYARWRAGKSELSRYAIYVLTAVLVVFFLRMFLSTRRQLRPEFEGSGLQEGQRYGLDSEFFLIERFFARAKKGRRSDETHQEWLDRLQQEGWHATQDLRGLLALHYRLRFDPRGIEPAERAILRREVREYLSRMEASGKR